MSVPTAGRGVVRRALLHQLDEVLASRCGLVVGPRGSGKTTVMRQWARTSRLPVVWGRCTPAGIAVRSGARTLVLTPDELGQSVLARRSPTLLVLDDAHELLVRRVEDDLEQLLVSSSPDVHVLLGSVRRPVFSLARSEFPPPTVVTPADLRLRVWEVDRLFRDVYGHPLALDDVDVLTDETEGWAAAVHLFHRSTSGLLPADRRRAIRSLGSDTSYVRDYLVDEVLAPVDRPTLDLLHWGSAFEELTARRYEELVEGTARPPLLGLGREGTAGGATAGAGTAGVGTVGEGTAGEGTVGERAAGEGTGGSSAVGGAAVGVGAGGEGTAARAAAQLRSLDRRWSLAWSEDGVRFRLPRVLRRHLQVAHAEHLGPTAARAWRQRAETVLRRDTAAGGDLAGESGHDARADGGDGRTGSAGATRDQTWVAVVQAATRRDPLTHARAARDLPGAAGAFAEGLCLLLAGDQRTARDALRRAAADPDAPPAVALGAALADAALTRGPAGRALTTFDRVHTAARREDLPWLARLAHGLVVGSDGTRTARAEAAALAARADREGDVWGAALVLSWAALAAMAAGSAEPDTWDDLERRWRALDAAVPAGWARACRALAAAALQLPDARQEAQSAEAVARAAGSPGALAYAYAALAATDPDGGAELRAFAVATADEHGVDVRPWAALAAATPESPVRRPRAVDDPVWGGVPLVDVRCLGEFRLRVDGVDADLSGVRPRARAALRVLALHAGRPVHRELLAEALWGDLDPRAALHNLHVSLSAVRRALEPGVPTRSSRLLVRDGETYTLVLRPGSTSDVAALDRAVREAARLRAVGDDAGARAELTCAVDLYRGDLLPEDGPAEWVVGERERLRLTAADAAVALAELELAHGRYDQAVAAATRGIRLDECRDHAWRVLVAAFTAAGDAAAAHRATQGYRAMLDTLGVAVGGTPGVGAARGGTPVVPTPIRRAHPTDVGPAPDGVSRARGTPPPRSPRGSPASPGTWS
ncbi:BTAD domain-containing putative transcriptional regulator [Cellulomonas biazotea]